MPITDPADIKLNDRHDVEALIGSPPGWTLRWGLTAMLAVFVLLLVVAYLVRYPDVVEARAVLTTENPPIRLAAGNTGKLSTLLVTNGQVVENGQLLAVLENPAALPDVEELDSILQKMSDEKNAHFLEENLPKNLQLGALQTSYAEFSKRLEDLRYFLSQDVNYLKINNLRKQINEVNNLNNSLARQEKILMEELGLAQKSLIRDSTLLSKKSLSQLEFERTQADWLTKRRELEALRSNSSQNNLRIREMQARILDLEQSQSDGESEKMREFHSELERMKGEIDGWRQTYLLVAPVSGTVALTKAWSEQQQVEAGMEVLTVVPQEAAGKIIAKAQLPNARSGKVELGFAANIRLDGFPYQEFGVLNGSVERIAAVPSENGYELEISVPADLKTSYGKQVPFRQEMQGTARIITKKQSLLERLFDKILATFHAN